MRKLPAILAVHLGLLVGCTSAAPQASPAPQALTAADHVPADAVTNAPQAPAAAPATAPINDPLLESAVPQPASSSTPAVEKPKDAAAQLDAALIHLAQNEPVQPLASLPPEERELITSVVDALTAFRHSLSQQGALMSSKTAPLLALSDQLRAQAPMAISTLALCRAVTQYGVYDPLEPARFAAGKETPVIIYCELDNFRSRPNSEGRFETKLSYEAVLYTDGDTSISVINKKPTNIVDLCRNRRRDFFLADRMTIPATLPVGKYLLKVTVVDQLANHVAEKSIPLMIAPN